MYLRVDGAWQNFARQKISVRGAACSVDDLTLFLAPFLPGQLCWLVYLIGSVIGGRISHTSADDNDSMDGQLVCRYRQTDTS